MGETSQRLHSQAEEGWEFEPRSIKFRRSYLYGDNWTSPGKESIAGEVKKSPLGLGKVLDSQLSIN